jgi:hypothetical protein
MNVHEGAHGWEKNLKGHVQNRPSTPDCLRSQPQKLLNHPEHHHAGMSQ